MALSDNKAKIQALLAGINALPESGGGAQVQSDYTQHDATQPDYIRNRPFWPEWSPVLLNRESTGEIVEFEGVHTFEERPRERFTRPIEGKRYVFGAHIVEDYCHVCTGTAQYGTFNVGGSVVHGIGIVDEQDSNSYAVLGELPIGWHWFINVSDAIVISNTTFFIIENDTYTELNVVDDAIELGGIPEGASVVYDFTDLFVNAKFDITAKRMSEALANNAEFTIEVDGTEFTLPSTEITYVAETEMMGVPCSLYMYGQAPLAAILRTGVGEYFALLDLKKLMGDGPTTKSIKVNFPGIFAPTIPAKKLSHDVVDLKPKIEPCIIYGYSTADDDYDGGYIHKGSVKGSSEILSLEEFMEIFNDGRPFYMCLYHKDAPVYDPHIKSYYHPVEIVLENNPNDNQDITGARIKISVDGELAEYRAK